MLRTWILFGGASFEIIGHPVRMELMRLTKKLPLIGMKLNKLTRVSE
jgi:hypothetical protein